MEKIKLIYQMLMAKSALITVFMISSGSLFYILDSLFFSCALGALFAFFLYWRLFGPIHFVIKRDIKKLIEQEAIYELKVLSVSKELEGFGFAHNSWFVGRGVIGEFREIYKTQIVSKGVGFYCVSIPYLPVYLIPWNKIKKISKNSLLCEEFNLDKDEAIELILFNDNKVILPFNSYDKLKSQETQFTKTPTQN